MSRAHSRSSKTLSAAAQDSSHKGHLLQLVNVVDVSPVVLCDSLSQRICSSKSHSITGADPLNRPQAACLPPLSPHDLHRTAKSTRTLTLYPDHDPVTQEFLNL